MENIIWDALIVASKWMYYIGSALTVGALLSPALLGFVFRDFRALLAGAWCGVTLAIIGATTWFFASTGGMAEDGLQGMLDPLMREIMWDSGIGESSRYRIGAVLCFSVGLVLMHTQKCYMPRAILLACVSGILLSAYSFTLVGHMVDQPVWARILLGLHVVAMLCWLGVLWPLIRFCQRAKLPQLYAAAERFGHYASGFVPAMLLVGVVLAWLLLDSFESLFTSSYGLVLVFKLLCVAGMLICAARNKFALVPALKVQGSIVRFKHSLYVESVLAIVLLVLCAVLTSSVGPESAA